VRLTRAGGLWLLAAALVAACGGATEPTRTTSLRLEGEIVQLRRDQVLDRVEVSLHNTGLLDVVVERLDVRVEGFSGGPPQPKDSPIPAGGVVNLPWPYGEVRCGPDRAPDVGRAVVSLRVRVPGNESVQRLRFVAGDPDRLMQRIADRLCTVERVRKEVRLVFGDAWRLVETESGPVLRGTLRTELLGPEPRAVTQVSGAILYGMRPAPTVATGGPLALLTPDDPTAEIPVEAYAARCDAHTIGEIKKPYEFLVWVGPPDSDGVAVTPTVTQPTKDALRQVCAF
jgi:hypothetical protein